MFVLRHCQRKSKDGEGERKRETSLARLRDIYREQLESEKERERVTEEKRVRGEREIERETEREKRAGLTRMIEQEEKVDNH